MMRVDSVGTDAWTSRTHDRGAEHAVRDVFSAVLASAGREGYASAEAIMADEPLSEQISSAWSNWFAEERRFGRYEQDKAFWTQMRALLVDYGAH